MDMRPMFWFCVVMLASAMGLATGADAQEKKSAKTLASLKSELAGAVAAGKLTEDEAVLKYEAAAAEWMARKPPAKKPDLSEFGGKLKALVAAGKLTEQEAGDLYRSVVGDDGKEQKPRNRKEKKLPQAKEVDGSDYKIPGLEEQRKLSATLPTTSTGGHEEGPVASGFFGWAAQATHRFMDNSHRGQPRLIQGISFRLDYRDHDSIGRSWENVKVRIGHGDWSSIQYNTSREFDLVDEPVVVFDKPWSFPTLKGFPATRPAEWGGPQNALNFRFDEPFAYNGQDAIYIEFVFEGGTAEDGREWKGDLPYGFEYYLDSMPESGGWRVAEQPDGIYRSPRVEAAVSYTAGGQSVWTASPKGMSYLNWDFRPAHK